MNTLDKVYDLTIDIKNIDVKYNSYAKFFDDDRETSVIRIKLLNDKTPMNLENCIVEASFILADNTYHNEACKIINSSEGVVELQLCQKCLVKGENIVRLSILKDNEISNTPVVTYEVRKGLYSDNPSFNNDPLTPILSQMLLDIKVTKVNQIELQERYEKSLPKIEGKIKEVESLINRVDTAIASGTQDLEVKEARVDKNGKSYAKLGDRLDEVDSQLEHKVNTSHLSINIKNYGAKGDGFSDDSEAFKNALSELKGGGCLFIPYGLYKIKNVEIKYSNVLLKGENSIIYTNSFSIQENVENTTFENLNFVGELNYYKITEVLNNGEKILIENNPFVVGDTFTGSNFNGIHRVDNETYEINGFDGKYYTTNLCEKGFNGSPLRKQYPMYVGNFNWSPILNFKGYNHNSIIRNCSFENSTGYSITIPRSNDILIQNNIFKNNGRDFILIGGMEGKNCENITFENNIFDRNIDFGKQCIISTNPGENKLINLNIRNNIFRKITETAISLKYAYCSCDGVNIENNVFEDCDLYGVQVLGKNINIYNNVFKIKDYEFARSELIIGGFNNGNDVNKSIVDFNNISISNNKFYKQGISITGFTTSEGNFIPPKNIKINDNVIDISLTGLFLRCCDAVIRDNKIDVQNTTKDNWDWSGMIFYNGCENIKILDNDFNDNIFIRVLNTTQTNNIIFDGNNFGNLLKDGGIYFGGKNMKFANSNILFKNNKFYKQLNSNITLNTQEKTIFENNYYINNGVMSDIPINLGSNARFSDNESKTHWISNANGKWLGQLYKIGFKTYRSSDLNNDFSFENGDVIINTDTSKNIFAWIYNDGWEAMNKQ